MIMGCPILFYLPVSLFILLLNFSKVVNGFNVKLIRTNSPNATYPMDIVQSPTYANNLDYVIEVTIGTPPVKFYGEVDTGSDLIWIQCLPCNNCFKQQNPLFDPQKSSTYTSIFCQEQECRQLPKGVSTCSSQNQCSYTYTYGDSSRTQGLLALDTITLHSTSGQPIPLQQIIFGCGHNNKGTFSGKAMGVIGLGGGSVSLISQIGPSFGGKRFSYCLVPYYTDTRISSPMSFGAGSEVLGRGVVSTPLVTKEIKTFYYITLQGISVGDTYLSFGRPPKGNMIVDIGSSLTYLPQQLYDQLVNEVKKRVPLQPIRGDPELRTLLCYRTSTNLKGPLITAHFQGADVQLTPIQTFFRFKAGVFCLGLSSTGSDVGIYGNFAQANYLIGIDLQREVVSFKAKDCTKQ